MAGAEAVSVCSRDLFTPASLLLLAAAAAVAFSSANLRLLYMAHDENVPNTSLV